LVSRHARKDVGRDQPTLRGGKPSGSANETEFRGLLDGADGNVAVAKRNIMDEVGGKAHDKGIFWERRTAVGNESIGMIDCKSVISVEISVLFRLDRYIVALKLTSKL
jgi:hypothetical protein